MFAKISKLLMSNEQMDFSVTPLDGGKVKLIFGFKPKSLPKSEKHSQLDKAEKEALEQEEQGLQILRAELAKPCKIEGTPEEIEEQLDNLLTIRSSDSFTRANDMLNNGIDSMEKAIAEAEEKLSSKKKSTKTTSAKSASPKPSEKDKSTSPKKPETAKKEVPKAEEPKEEEFDLIAMMNGAES